MTAYQMLEASLTLIVVAGCAALVLSRARRVLARSGSRGSCASCSGCGGCPPETSMPSVRVVAWRRPPSAS